MQGDSTQQPRNLSGVFIVFEGGDGTGKSTQARLLAESLRSAGLRVETTREPGGTPVSEALRGIVLDPTYAPMDPITEALIYAAARSAHVNDKILPWLRDGAVVISDRFLDSSLAYQGAGRGLGLETVAEINAPAVRGLKPDLTIVLTMPVADSRARQGERGTSDRIEAESDEFHGTLMEEFERIAALDPQRYLVIDARASIEDIAQQIYAAAAPLLDGMPRSAGENA
ncbi:dTMP kinase [Pseudoglutamicibacter cumminsii]|uniref:dTMP kinase n=1 Tax=Pseudoglutamicibacter cumminsii TaxID=156979 RepID=UPI0021A4743A|nr:dTMP kinase [Pseudoglutamicibacter cumminsii]MCT1685892.1 dTMP kinase [Pseudoglutamicibacter cumminsii]